MSGPQKFRKKPVVIEAMQWLGDNEAEIIAFAGANFRTIEPGSGDYTAEVYDYLHGTWIGMRTRDWVIRGVQGEFYPCKADIFAATYEAVE